VSEKENAMYDRRNRELLGRLGAQMRAITSRCEREGNRGLTSSEVESWQKLRREHDQLERQIENNEDGGGAGSSFRSGPGRVAEFDLEEMQDTMRLTPSARRERDRDPHARAFGAYLRRGMDGLSAEDRDIVSARMFTPTGIIRNAQQGTGGASGGFGSQGGYLVPQGFSDMLEEALKWFGGIDNGFVGRFKTAMGNPLPWPTVNDTSNKGRIIGQNVQATETDLTFGQVTFQSYIFCSDIVLVPLALMQDSYFDIDQLIARLLGIRLGRLYNNMCTVGTGSDEPTGIVTAAAAAGNIYQFPTGETTSGPTYDDLVNMEHSVDPEYRYARTSAWMFPDAILKNIKKLVDGNNRPLWQPGLTASFENGAAVDITATRPTVLGHPYLINQDMATPAANAYTMLFGDLSTFKVRQVAEGTSVMRLAERYADYLQVGFIAWDRADSNLIDAGTHPIVLGQQSAS
jgi:HK97 family phage major capsid protein